MPPVPPPAPHSDGLRTEKLQWRAGRPFRERAANAANAAFSILDNKWKRVSPSITPCSDWGCGAAAHCTAALVDNAAVAN